MTLNPPSRVTPDKPKDLHVTLLPTRAGIKAWDKHLPICGLGKWRVR